MIAIEDQARSIFLVALERAPEHWPAFLGEACGDNAELRARVAQLLLAHQAMGSIHRGGADAPAATTDDPIRERPGTLTFSVISVAPDLMLEAAGRLTCAWVNREVLS